MSIILNALPDLRSQAESLQRALAEKNNEIALLREELRDERAKNAALAVGVGELRHTLEPLHHALQVIFGQIDAMDATESAAAPRPMDDAKRKVWESWKQKLGGNTAKAIDVLMLHGSITPAQLRIQLQCASRTVSNILGTLKKAGLINRANGKIILKEL